jgi:hypothetical protein
VLLLLELLELLIGELRLLELLLQVRLSLPLVHRFVLSGYFII